MRVFKLKQADDFEGWRTAARLALSENQSPREILFEVEGMQQNLLDGLPTASNGQSGVIANQSNTNLTVSKAFLSLAKQVVCHSNGERFLLLYRLLVRSQQEKNLLLKSVDPDVHKTNVLAKEVRRDMHKMKAFVRFRKTGETEQGQEQFVAWFEPTHHIVRATAPFFMRRFAGMQWSILTPNSCAHWDGQSLSFSDGIPKSKAPQEDALEDYWRSYYASIFNPARLKINAMTSEMPKKYWKNLPEAELIPELINKAQIDEQKMMNSSPTEPIASMMAHVHVPNEDTAPEREEIETMEQLNSALSGCRACPLWQPATQAVCGKGDGHNGLMLVGEQPGDQEDIQGEPFIGRTGQLLWQTLNELDIKKAYVTNAVKHFKFEPRGKRRLHKNPSAKEIDHCRWWLHKEIELVAPKVIVALGASAFRGLTGKPGKITQLRGRSLSIGDEIPLIVTRHPSSILRIQDLNEKQIAFNQLKDDLYFAQSLIQG